MLRATLLVSLLALAGGTFACASPEDQFYSAREANERVMLFFFLKDSECSTAHVLTIPILAPAHKDEVDACIIGIIDATCDDWVKNDPTPDECRGLQVSLIR